jgi:hypothetical protein
MAFLDSTERSYGTADMVAEARADESMSSGDHEKDFFERIRAELGTDSPFLASAEVVNVLGDAPGTSSDWCLLELSMSKSQLMMADNLYNIWDMIFFMDLGNGDFDSARMAIVTKPADILTIRFGPDVGLQRPIDFPRVFYIDRYLGSHREEMSQLQIEMRSLAQAAVQAQNAIDSLTKFIEPAAGKQVDRVALSKRAIGKDKQRIWRLKANAVWAKHENTRDDADTEHYLPVEDDTPDGPSRSTELSPEESQAKQNLEADISFYEAMLEEMQRKVESKSYHYMSRFGLGRPRTDPPAQNSTRRRTLASLSSST